MLEITLKRGLVGKPANQRRIVAALGLHKYGSSVKRKASPTISGMVKKIEHLLDVRECKDGGHKAVANTKSHPIKKTKPEEK